MAQENTAAVSSIPSISAAEAHDRILSILGSTYGVEAANKLENALVALADNKKATTRDAYRAFDAAANVAVGDFAKNGVVKGKTLDRAVISKKELYVGALVTAVVSAAAGVGGTLLVQKIKARRAAKIEAAAAEEQE